ncbi:LOW QUALITY PROTEIN: atrial natriuretic peptide receptor 1-like [Ptychodera flava]|uniref:LOW QUALITY PROTEIN: atrial natriuretic peptide receptor 1-like n=1 Tax=Ptychodera flava TaxID=63121 RepID=UPI003969E5BA
MIRFAAFLRFLFILPKPCMILCLMAFPMHCEDFRLLITLSDWETPFSKGRTGAAHFIALEKVNRDPTLLPGRNLTFTLYNSTGYDISTLEAVLNLTDKERYSAFFGPVYSVEAEPIAKLSMVWNTAYMCSSCLDDKFLIKKYRFETMIRSFGTFWQFGDFFTTVAEHFGWDRIAVFVERNTSNPGSNFFEQPALSFKKAAARKNMTIVQSQEFNGSSDIKQLLKGISQIARIIFISARGENVRKFMLSAYDLGLINGNFVFFCIEFFKLKRTFGDFSWNGTDGRNEEAKKAYEALFILSFYRPDTEEFNDFAVDMVRRSKAEFGYEYADDEEVSVLAGMAHDTVILYAIALNETLAEGGDPYDGKSLVRRLYGRTFRGIQGNITIDMNGDRDADFMMYDMTDVENGTFQVVANYFGYSKIYQTVPGRRIHWPGGLDGPPRDEPICGFFNEYCPQKEPTNPIYIVATVFAGLVVGFTGIIVIMYRKYKLQQAIANMLWRIDFDDLVLHGQKIGTTTQQTPVKSSTVSLKSTTDNDHVFTRTCSYKGNVYAIKFLKPKRIALTPRLLLELKQMRDLSHANVTRFIGACFDDADRNCLITEYCQKGSLQDILENDAIKLDWMFRYSLMLDVCKGLEYLQNCFLRCHGNLKSSNCVVDSRFVLKLTDFGLNELRSRLPSTSDSRDALFDNMEAEELVYQNMLWMAPEIIRGTAPSSGTQKADIYALAIIMHEIALRSGPFYVDDTLVSPRDIIDSVRAVRNPSYRPVVDIDECPKELEQLMSRCWAEDPSDRPDVSHIKAIVRKLNPATKKGDNILDNLLTRMEQYANNLEGLVEERTAKYLEEKRRAEDLLDRLLPRSVSEQLKQGKEVKAESFDSVTIYFSDIVGFTSLSASSTPMQVVDLLNDLYTSFDAIIDNYDVYKVETIGDAYMVASGLPVRNGDNHASEIAKMALALFECVRTFKIRHRPGEQLKLRIGIHSGPVCAGVVGLKMPRYCLFGDAVNTASRMESTGQPLMIHISVSTANILKNFGGFQVELRGQVELKGKGFVTTFWLINYHPEEKQQNIVILNNLSK